MMLLHARPRYRKVLNSVYGLGFYLVVLFGFAEPNMTEQPVFESVNMHSLMSGFMHAHAPMIYGCRYFTCQVQF